MSIKPPFFCALLADHIPVDLEGIYQRTTTTVSDADKALGVQLLIEATCDLIDQCFGTMFDQLATIHPSKELNDARHVIEDIKGKAKHYMGWVGGHLSNTRLPPVIAHFHALNHYIDRGDGVKPYMTCPITPAFAAEVTRIVDKMENGQLEDINEVVDLLIKVMDVTLEPLVLIPIRLLKFNFLINKTLDGVIAVVRMLNRHMLRKLAPAIPRDVYPLIARHLRSFLEA